VGPELTTFMGGADAGRLAATLQEHLASKSGLRRVPELAPQAVGEVAAFLRSVALTAGERGPDEQKIDEPAPVRPPPRQGGPRRP
jgi:hypothetical protein